MLWRDCSSQIGKRMRMVWRDWAGDGETNAHGMARLGRRWRNERAWYGEIGLEMEKRTRMVWRDWAGMEKQTRMVWRDLAEHFPK